MLETLILAAIEGATGSRIVTYLVFGVLTLISCAMLYEFFMYAIFGPSIYA